MKPIETKWGDRIYRSRTEARWAVALSLSRVAFEYEAEGFKLPGGWYLPDFWLPDQKLWLEIKGVDPTERERRLAIELEAQSGRPVYFGVGSPAPSTDWQEVIHCGPDRDSEIRVEWLTPEARASALAERFDGGRSGAKDHRGGERNPSSAESLRSLAKEFRSRSSRRWW